MTSFLLNVTRSAFALGERISPRLTGWIAFNLFRRTANPEKMSDRERKAVESARALMVSARRHWLTTRYGRIAAHEYRPDHWSREYPTVLVVHGWQSRSEHMASLCAYLCGRGYRVISIDLPGHGRSSGRKLDMARAVAAVRESELWFGPFVAGVGHSFGSAVLASAMSGLVRGFEPVSFDRLALISSPSAMAPVFEGFGKFVGLGQKSQKWMNEQVRIIAGLPIEMFDIPAVLAGLKTPVSVVHCRDDKELPIDYARLIGAAGDHVSVHEVEGLGHRRIIANEGVHQIVSDFLDSNAEEIRIAA